MCWRRKQWKKESGCPVNKVAFVLNRPGGLAVIVKATRIGDELYVTSLYRLSENDSRLKKALRNLGKK